VLPELPVATEPSSDAFSRPNFPAGKAVPAAAAGQLPTQEPVAVGFFEDGTIDESTTGRGDFSLEAGSIMIVWSRKHNKLSGLSKRTGDWSHLAIAPQKFAYDPLGNGNVGVVRVGKTISAYSGTTGTWDILQPPARSAGTARIEVASGDLIKVIDGKLLYTFASANGKWTSPNDSDFQSATALSRNSTQPANRSPQNQFGFPGSNTNQNNPFRSRGSDRFDQEALQLARQYRGKGLDDAQARKMLSKAVTVAFDKRQEFHKS